jgi:hypothetical protein
MHWVELMQTIVATLGVPIILWGIRDATYSVLAASLDRRMEESIAQELGMVALARLRDELMKAGVIVGFLVIGVASCLLPPPTTPPQPTEVWLAIALTHVTLCLCTFGLVANAVMERFEHTRLLKRLDRDRIKKDLEDLQRLT